MVGFGCPPRVVASGSIDIFAPVFESLKKTGIRSPEDITKQLRASRDAFYARVHASGQMPPAVDRTTLLITFVEGDAVHLRLFHHDENFVQTIPPVGGLLLLQPNSADAAMSLRRIDWAANSMKRSQKGLTRW